MKITKKCETLHSNTYTNKQCNCRDKESCPNKETTDKKM